MARQAPRRLLKSLGFASGITLTGATAIFLSTRPFEQTTSSPNTRLQKQSNTPIIPPRFPKIKSRAEQLADLRRASSTSGEEYDLLIIGGGATGAGIALDAATRGLKVALVERDDFASGTSSKSTKLVHGGVRYLEKAVWNLDYDQYSLVKEALRERKNFLKVAPHLASSLPILLPLQKWWQAPYFWAGTKCYDLLAGSQGLESSYYMTRKRALEAFPSLKKDIIGALVYYDGQQNDSRMNISLALTAALYGATTLNHVEVTGFEKDSNGRLCGAIVQDLYSTDSSPPSQPFTVRTKGIINATGPFVDSIEHMASPHHTNLVAPSEGVHVVLPGHLSPSHLGLLDACTSDGRVMFFLPWEGNVLAGTTDTPCTISPDPQAREADISFILCEVSKYLDPSIQLQRSDVLAAWSGIRPLMRDPNAKDTSSLVRNHLITVSPSGLLTCAGGKWTTYRQMAQDAVDRAISEFNLHPQPLATTAIDISGTYAGSQHSLLDGSCRTLDIQLLGAHGYTPTLYIDLIRHFNLPLDIAQHLARAYGDRAWSVASTLTASQDSEATAEPTRLSQSYPILIAEVPYAVQNEYCLTATDFLARRTRLSFLDVHAALSALPTVIDTMASELNWTEARKSQEWCETVTFLKSMGLEEGLADVTREQVVKGAVKKYRRNGRLGAGSGKESIGAPVQELVAGGEAQAEAETVPVAIAA